MRHWSDARRKALVVLSQRLAPCFEGVSLVARDLGFDAWSFVVLDRSPRHAPLLIKTTAADSFVDHYIEQRFYVQDPRLQHGLVSLQALRWAPSLFSEAPRLWQTLQDAGVDHGMSQACHHPSGVTALLCFARSQPALEIDEFQAKVGTVLSLANRLTVATVEQIANDASIDLADGETHHVLTRREITVLEKTAAGHTAAHIAADMSLSKRTVQFHISSAITKLNVPNKTALVAQAILLGLIDGSLPDVSL